MQGPAPPEQRLFEGPLNGAGCSGQLEDMIQHLAALAAEQWRRFHPGPASISSTSDKGSDFARFGSSVRPTSTSLFPVQLLSGTLHLAAAGSESA